MWANVWVALLEGNYGIWHHPFPSQLLDRSVKEQA
jgi:hypothetical protein